MDSVTIFTSCYQHHWALKTLAHSPWGLNIKGTDDCWHPHIHCHPHLEQPCCCHAALQEPAVQMSFHVQGHLYLPLDKGSCLCWLHCCFLYLGPFSHVLLCCQQVSQIQLGKEDDSDYDSVMKIRCLKDEIVHLAGWQNCWALSPLSNLRDVALFGSRHHGLHCVYETLARHQIHVSLWH